MRFARKVILLAISVVLPLMYTGTALAQEGLTDAQIKVLQSGVYYFNTEVDACLGLNSETQSTTGGTGKIYMIGDSVAAGASTALDTAFKSKGFTDVYINAVPSRSLANSSPNLNGLGVLESDKPNYSAASTVVVELGTNSSGLSTENINKAIGIIRSGAPSAKIFWVNVGADNSKRNGAPLNSDSLNQTIQSGTGYTVIDWAGQVKQHPEYIDSNPTTGLGVHLSADGKPAYANTVANGLSGGTGSNQSAQNCTCSGASTLPGNDNPEKIWNFLAGKGLPPAAIAGVMGNLQKESGFNPRRVQGTRTPEGDRDNMTIDGKTGYGLAQWTSRNRQQNLHDFATSRNTIDGDLSTQLDFLYKEAAGVWDTMKTFTDVSNATIYFHNTYEKSADGTEGINTRIQFATDILAKYGGGGSASPSTSSGGSCAQGGASAKSIVETALKFSWDDGKKHGLEPKPEYQAAASTVYGSGATTEKLSNCSAFTATVMITGGVDPNYPTGCSKNQLDYAREHSDKYTVIDNVSNVNELQPGDILVVGGCDKNGHTFIFVGEQAGTSYNMASASQGNRMPSLGTADNKTLADSRGSYSLIRIKG